jgi:7-keto-8-aminopelargonate synthetase-like enzyme
MALAWRSLVDKGVYTNPVVSPGVPLALLRTSYIATHTLDQLQQALDVLEEVGENMDLIPSRAERNIAPAVN